MIFLHKDIDMTVMQNKKITSKNLFPIFLMFISSL